MPLRVDDPSASLSLLYVDDLIDQWLTLLAHRPRESGFAEPRQVYRTTVGELAEIIRGFVSDRANGMVSDVGAGQTRAPLESRAEAEQQEFQ